MKHKALIALSSATIVLAFAIFIILQCNSQEIALKQAGVNTSYIYQIEELDINANQEFRILAAMMNDKRPVLIHMEKNRLGFWFIRNIEYDSAIGFEKIGWINRSGTRRYAATDVPQIDHEFHLAYCGNNALKLIEFPQASIPQNVTVTIHQVGSFYTVHVISFDEDQLNNLDVFTTMQELGCIP